MKYLLSFVFLLLMVSCDKPLFGAKEYDVFIEIRYESEDYFNPKKIMTHLDYDATVYVFSGLLQNNSGLVFDGNGNMVGNGKSIKYDIILNGALNTIRLKKGYHTFGIVSGKMKKNGKYETYSGTVNVDGNLDKEESYHVFKL